jgi:hypothetical protein
VTDQPYPPLRPQTPLRPRRRPTPWPMIIGIVVLAVLAAALLFILLGGNDEDPTSATSPSPSAAGSATTPASVAASAPSASPPVGGLAPDAVVSLTVDALALRDEPGLAGEIRWRLPAETVAFVIAGPTEADGLPWYQISGMGLPYASGCITPEPGELLNCPAFLGWVAGAGADGAEYLAPTPAPDCPAPPHTVVSLSEQAYTLRLICFDTDALTFRAWWPEPPDDAGPAACAAADTAIGWLVCPNINDVGLAANPDDPGGRLALSIDPATGLAMPERGQWVEVTGHFDDPAARNCGDVAEQMGRNAGDLVFNCRLQFVLTAVAPAAGP